MGSPFSGSDLRIQAAEKTYGPSQAQNAREVIKEYLVYRKIKKKYS